jgi:hypothetical protein
LRYGILVAGILALGTALMRLPAPKQLSACCTNCVLQWFGQVVILLVENGRLKWMRRSLAEPRKEKGEGGTTKHLLLV